MRTIMWVLLGCLLLPASTAWANLWVYDGSVDPVSTDSAGPGNSFSLWNTGGTAPEALVATLDTYHDQMVGSVDGYAWLMNDGPSGKRQYKTTPNANIDGNPGGAGATLVIRMRTLFKFGSHNENFGMFEDDGLTTTWHWSGAGDTIYNYQNGAPGVLRGMRTNDPTYTFTESAEWYADWHIIRVVTQRDSAGGTHSANVDVYFDEDPTPVLSYTKDRDKVEPDAFLFGVGSTAGQQSVLFDGLVATDQGGYAPGENAAFEEVLRGVITPEPATLTLLLCGLPLLRRRR